MTRLTELLTLIENEKPCNKPKKNEKRRDEYIPKFKQNNESIEKNCLRCGKEFEAKSRFLFMCDPCKK